MSTPINPYDLLKSIVQLSTSSIPVEIKQDRMLQSISRAFETDRCLLLRPEKIIHNGFLSRLVSEKKPLWVEEGSSFPKENIPPEEKEFLCPTFACIPMFDEVSFQGILFISFSKNHRFSPQEIDLLLQIGETIGAVLRVEGRRTGALEIKCSKGDYHQNPLDEKIAKRVFYTRTPLAFNHSGEEKPSLSILCAPFLSKGKSFGTLAFYDKDSNASKFDERDLQLLLMMANQMSCAIENALIHYETSEISQRHEKRAKELSTLWELNKALLTTVNFERILHFTLTAITIGEGLKFNRAMLFLVNEKKRILEGTMAVGPDSAEEVGRVWASLSQRQGR